MALYKSQCPHGGMNSPNGYCQCLCPQVELLFIDIILLHPKIKHNRSLGPRWWHRKALSSPPATRHTKITTIFRETIVEKNWKTSRKQFLQLKR